MIRTVRTTEPTQSAVRIVFEMKTNSPKLWNSIDSGYM